MERLLTPSEVSVILGSKDTKECRFVRELNRTGILTGARIGKKLMFRESDVEEYINRVFDQQNKK